MTSGIKIAFLCNRLGPYHFAKLNAASIHAEIIAIESSAVDQTYAWDNIKVPGRFKKVTLYNDAPVNMQLVNDVIKKINNVLNEIKPQVVAISGWDELPSLIALRWCLKNKTPSILMSDSQKHDEIRLPWKELFKQKIVKLNSAGFASGSTAIDYLISLGMPEGKIFPGCNVVDNIFFAESAREFQQNIVTVRKKFDLPEKYFLSSNRFIREKNLFFLLQAYAKYCEKVDGDPWKLVLLGDGPLKYEIKSHSEELGLNNNVIFPGFRQYEELPAYYGLAGAFIHASTKDTWGLVVNEAMACGLPVIVSSPCGCAPDLVRHACNGFIFDPYDLDELAGHLVFVSGNTCNREKMGKASRNIIDGWSLDTFASNLIKAANMAKESDHPRVDYVSKAILWSLIHLKRSN
jgi:1,2-diacylglycerol 3-alpha-glucosyltransferase